MHPSHDPLHGVTLATIVMELQAKYGWAEMARRIPIRCFQFDPSLKSSLTFLRRTPWARQKVEAWYIAERNATAPASDPWQHARDRD
jgi:uncharacterized protein (DUF2132 family)